MDSVALIHAQVAISSKTAINAARRIQGHSPHRQVPVCAQEQ